MQTQTYAAACRLPAPQLHDLATAARLNHVRRRVGAIKARARQLAYEEDAALRAAYGVKAYASGGYVGEWPCDLHRRQRKSAPAMRGDVLLVLPLVLLSVAAGILVAMLVGVA